MKHGRQQRAVEKKKSDVAEVGSKFIHKGHPKFLQRNLNSTGLQYANKCAHKKPALVIMLSIIMDNHCWMEE